MVVGDPTTSRCCASHQVPHAASLGPSCLVVAVLASLEAVEVRASHHAVPVAALASLDHLWGHPSRAGGVAGQVVAHAHAVAAARATHHLAALRRWCWHWVHPHCLLVEQWLHPPSLGAHLPTTVLVLVRVLVIVMPMRMPLSLEPPCRRQV